MFSWLETTTTRNTSGTDRYSSLCRCRRRTRDQWGVSCPFRTVTRESDGSINGIRECRAFNPQCSAGHLHWQSPFLLSPLFFIRVLRDSRWSPSDESLAPIPLSLAENRDPMLHQAWFISLLSVKLWDRSRRILCHTQISLSFVSFYIRTKLIKNSLIKREDKR